jgi:myo-inositol 2-dehydrogenase / D-chiro-inositol 1-dehydrogenase
MSIGIGVVGAGVMGADHAMTLARHVSGATLIAICDADEERATRVATQTGAVRQYSSADSLIRDNQVDAVLIASPDETHADLVLACLEARKPVLCEKPLASTADRCLDIVRAEVRLGRQWVQVGYMRRFDPPYLAMRDAIATGQCGRPLLVHCTHRGVKAAPFMTSDMVVSAGAVHEIDITRWLLDEEIASAQAFASRSKTSSPIRDPQFLVMKTKSGVLITVEIFESAGYGYDVRSEVVCDNGTISLAAPIDINIRKEGTESFAFAADWRPRFAAAYRAQLQAWVNSVLSGTPCGASAWDGYVATAVADACLESTNTSRRIDIQLAPRPDLYK